MNKFLLVAAAFLSLSACNAPPEQPVPDNEMSEDGTVITKAE